MHYQVSVTVDVDDLPDDATLREVAMLGWFRILGLGDPVVEVRSVPEGLYEEIDLEEPS